MERASSSRGKFPMLMNPVLAIRIQTLVPAAHDRPSRFDLTGRRHHDFDKDKSLDVFPHIRGRVIGWRKAAAGWPFIPGVNDRGNGLPCVRVTRFGRRHLPM